METFSATGVTSFLVERQNDVQLLNLALSQSLSSLLSDVVQPGRKRKRDSLKIARERRRTRSFYARKYRRGNAKTRLNAGFASKLLCRSARRRKALRMDSTTDTTGKPMRLMTHVWHAKRMRMIPCSGWMLPVKSNDRSVHAVADHFLSNYKFNTKKNPDRTSARGGCVMQDASYFRCIRIGGSYESIMEKLEAHFVCLTGKIGLFTCRFTSLFLLLCLSQDPVDFESYQNQFMAYVKNPKELELIWYQDYCFPTCAVGPILLVNVPAKRSLIAASEAETLHEIFICCHHRLYDTVRSDLISALPSTLPLQVQDYSSWNRIRLRGPSSSSILSAICKDQGTSTNIVNRKMAREMAPVSHTAYIMQQLKRMMPGADKATQWGCGAVISIDIADPRTCIQDRKGIPIASTKPIFKPKRPAQSIIWRVNSTRLCFREDHEINTANSGIINSGMQQAACEIGNDNNISTVNEESVPPTICPLLLIRKSAQNFKDVSNRLPVLDGFDIIVSSRWTRTIWLQLIKFGAVAVGDEEMEKLSTTCALPSFPRDFPDTVAGQQFWKEKCDDWRLRISMRPPRKRYALPDLFLLLQRIKHYRRDEELTAQVVQSPNADGLPNCMESIESVPCVIVRRAQYSQDLLPPVKEVLHDPLAAKKLVTDGMYRIPEMPHFTLLPVAVVACGRGVPMDLAELYRPLPSDYEAWLEHKKCYAARRSSKKVEGAGKASFIRHTEFPPSQSNQNNNEIELPSSIHLQRKEWPGVFVAASQLRVRYGHDMFDRPLIGAITSGRSENQTCGRNRLSIGVCSVVALNDMYHDVAWRVAEEPTSEGGLHMQTHQLVLFRNCRSRWLRPALLFTS